jgi:GTP cyclohydrolase II
MSAIRRVARESVPGRYGTFEMFVHGTPEHKEHVALTIGAIDDGRPVLVRVHSECLTGDVLGSSRCQQLAYSLQSLQQQGRSIGLTMKISAYALQERGLECLRTKRGEMGHLFPKPVALDVAGEDGAIAASI